MEIRMIGIRKDAGGHWVEAGIRWINPAMKTTLFIRRKATDTKHFIQGWSDLYHVTKTEGFTQVEVQPAMLKTLGLWGTNFNKGFSETIRMIKNRNHAERFLIEFKDDAAPPRRHTASGALEHLEAFGNAVKAAGRTLKPKSTTHKHRLSRHKLDTLGDLETAIFREYGIRVVFRVSSSYEHGTSASNLAELAAKFDSEFEPMRNVARLRSVLSTLITYYPYAGQKDVPAKLLPANILVISKAGVLANGNTLLKNLVF